MLNPRETDAGLFDLRTRIQELERANNRLSGELEKQKRREKSLWESELRFRTMADGTPVIIWVTDALGMMEFINQAYTEFFGVALEEVQAKTWEMLIHPDDQAIYVDDYMECLRERRPFHQQCRVLRKDGQWRWIISQGQPRFSESGSFLGMAGSSIDITERKQMEEALRQSEERFRFALQNSPIVVFSQDNDLRYTWVYNPSPGFKVKDVLGKRDEDIYQPEDAKFFTSIKRQVLATGIARRDEVITHRPDSSGGNLVHDMTTEPLRDFQGTIIGVVCSAMNITERKRAEQDLKASEEHFRVALKNSPILVYTTDQELRYTWIYNPPFGATAAQIVGRTDEELGLGESITELVALKRSVLETGTGRREEIQVRYQGVEYYYDVTAEPIQDEKGGVIGLTVAAIDISEKKSIEKIVKESEIQIELQRQLMQQREQERLLIAQEIHDGPTQTLAAIILDLEMTKLALSDPTLQTELDQLGSNIKSAVRELRGIIAEIRPPLLERFSLSQAMRAHADDFNGKYSDLELTYDIAEDEGRLSKETCVGLFRIYQEALSNIIRHAQATKASVRFSIVEQMAVLEIEDNGREMKIIPDLTALTANGHYGLAGMRERAQAVNGEFQLRSGLGKGTTITVKIPINKKM